MKDKISLGTVKLGDPSYGISSASSKSFDPELFLKEVWDLGVHYLDTSPRYGSQKSEQAIGNFHKKNPKLQFQISTKIDGLRPESEASEREVLESAERSLKNLNLSRVDVIYLHQNELEITTDKRIQKSLARLKSEGLANKLGVSVYSKEEFQFALESELYDTIQFPLNVFDSSYYFSLIEPHQGQKEFVARSILLQGLLLNRDNLRREIKNYSVILKYFEKLEGIGESLGYSLLELSHSFLSRLCKVDRFLIGTTSISNLRTNLESVRPLDDATFLRLKELSLPPKTWSNPRNW